MKRTYKLQKMPIVEAIEEALDQCVTRRPTRLELKSMAQNIAEAIETEITRRIEEATVRIKARCI